MCIVSAMLYLNSSWRVHYCLLYVKFTVMYIMFFFLLLFTVQHFELFNIIIIIKHRKITSWHADPTTSKYIRAILQARRPKPEFKNNNITAPNSSKKHLPGSHYYIRTCWKPLLSKSPWCPRCPWQHRLARQSPHVQCWESERASWPAAAPGEDRRWKPQPSRPAQRWCWTCWGRTTWCWSPLAAGECWTGGALAPSSCTHWKHNHNNNLSFSCYFSSWRTQPVTPPSTWEWMNAKQWGNASRENMFFSFDFAANWWQG